MPPTIKPAAQRLAESATQLARDCDNDDEKRFYTALAELNAPAVPKAAPLPATAASTK